MKHIGKMLILTFEDHRDLRIDFSCRKVIKNNRQECTTAAAVVRVLGGKFLEVHIE